MCHNRFGCDEKSHTPKGVALSGIIKSRLSNLPGELAAQVPGAALVVRYGATRILQTNTQAVCVRRSDFVDVLVEGIDQALERSGIPAGDLELVLHGTTLATNAIIERKGARTALLTTEGFRDVLDIGYESRYDQYDIFIEKPDPSIPGRNNATPPW